MDRRLSRRRLLLGAGAVLAGTGLVGACRSGPEPGSAATTKTIEMAWWGSTERHKRTQDALAAFSRQHPNLKVNTEFSGWSGYWDKLATRTAGGNPPDVIQMDYSYIIEYARRGSLRPLDEFVPGVIDLTGFPPDVLAGGKIDDKLYGVNAGINSFALFVNLTQLRALGFEPPAANATWADFAALTKKISKKAPSGVFPTEYAVYDGNALECWQRQRGKSLFTADGALGFVKSDLAEWIAYWEDLRKTGAAAPADLQATTNGDVQNTLLVRKKALFDFASSNQLSAYASLLKDEIGLLMYPQGAAGSNPGQYLKPSMLMSMSAKTQHPKEAATLIDALLTDPEITAILGSERGIPPSTSVRGALKAKADPVEQRTYEYIDFVSSRVGALPPPAPLGGAEVTGKALMFAGQQVAFGKASIDQAVNQFFEDAARALKK